MLGDPAIPKDNTYQVTLVIAGVTYVLDAGAIDKSMSKGQFINDGLTETCYEREYWLRRHQWAKLSEADQLKAAELYKICAPDMLIN